MTTPRQYIEQRAVKFQQKRKISLLWFQYPARVLTVASLVSFLFLKTLWIPISLILIALSWEFLGSLIYRCPVCKHTPRKWVKSWDGVENNEIVDYHARFCPTCGTRLRVPAKL